jgi:hypothetical protein
LIFCADSMVNDGARSTHGQYCSVTQISKRSGAASVEVENARIAGIAGPGFEARKPK